MHRILSASFLLGAVLSLALLPASLKASQAEIGKAAPSFSLKGSDGKTHALADYKGKYVVLEWTNPDCPFVHKFYDSGSMQALQQKWTGKKVTWLRINSGAPGHEGFQDAAALTSYSKDKHVAATASLMDPTGEVGHEFGARTTPHMFVIDPKGTLIYAGGIDNKPSPDPSDIASATNYVDAALDEAMAGKPVTQPTARPYGCAVKYASN